MTSDEIKRLEIVDDDEAAHLEILDLRRKVRALELRLVAFTESGLDRRAAYKDLRGKVASLYDAIAHGDDEHRRWLREKLDEHFAPHSSHAEGSKGEGA